LESQKSVTLTSESESDLVLTSNKPESFTKAVYVKPNLLEVAKHDGTNLTPMQQAMLFNILTASNKVFKGWQRPTREHWLA
jgi:hypothetical protein